MAGTEDDKPKFSKALRGPGSYMKGSLGRPGGSLYDGRYFYPNQPLSAKDRAKLKRQFGSDEVNRGNAIYVNKRSTLSDMPQANDRNALRWGALFEEHRIIAGDSREPKPDADSKGLWRHLFGVFVGERQLANWRSVYALMRPEFFIECERKRAGFDQDLEKQGIEQGPENFSLELRPDLSLDIILLGSPIRLGILEGTPGEIEELRTSGAKD